MFRILCFLTRRLKAIVLHRIPRLEDFRLGRCKTLGTAHTFDLADVPYQL